MDFNSNQFARRFHYDGGDLGARLTDTGTQFRLWAPTARRVQLRLYPDGGTSAPLDCVELQPGPRGVWYYAAPRRLAGVYYDFEVTVDGVTRTTADPYARACGCNGGRSMVVDLPATRISSTKCMCGNFPGTKAAVSRRRTGASTRHSPVPIPPCTGTGGTLPASATCGGWG